MQNSTFSILITTKNRKADLAFTLSKINYLLQDNSVNCVVFDDGSTDGTFEYVKENFPKVQLNRNLASKGYIFCRNTMLNECKAIYAISLDDDAHFVTKNPLEFIQKYFEENANCGLVALRIFWGLGEPKITVTNKKQQRVQGFVGCAHVWRMQTWREIPNYPEWFVFYGEENFASYQMFKKDWEVHYLPEVLVNHRVDVKSRKKNKDYRIRLRRSLRSGWYLYFLFYPWSVIPKRFAYSFWKQIQNKIIKGDSKAIVAIIQATFDVIINFPRLLRQSNRFSSREYLEYEKLNPVKIYWKPEDEK